VRDTCWAQNLSPKYSFQLGYFQWLVVEGVVQADVPLGSVAVPGPDFGDADFVDYNTLHLLEQERIEDDVEPYSVEDNTGGFG